MTKSAVPVIAIDGPAGSGKGTLARALAEYLGYDYLDTGSLYRAVAWKALDAKIDPSNESEAAKIAQNILSENLSNPAFRDEKVGEGASVVAAHPSVRKALFDVQKGFGNNASGVRKGAILDGRDIGTKIFPETPLKFYITATPETRAERRFKELQSKGETCKYEHILRDIKARDARDSSRIVDPLTPADDAVVIDTSGLDPEHVVEKVLSVIRSKTRGLS